MYDLEVVVMSFNCLLFYPIPLHPSPSLASLISLLFPPFLSPSRQVPGICWSSQQEQDRERLPSACPRPLLPLFPQPWCLHHHSPKQTYVWGQEIHGCWLWPQGPFLHRRVNSKRQHHQAVSYHLRERQGRDSYPLQRCVCVCVCWTFISRICCLSNS